MGGLPPPAPTLSAPPLPGSSYIRRHDWGCSGGEGGARGVWAPAGLLGEGGSGAF
jgi:hypothetical protein